MAVAIAVQPLLRLVPLSRVFTPWQSREYEEVVPPRTERFAMNQRQQPKLRYYQSAYLHIDFHKTDCDRHNAVNPSQFIALGFITRACLVTEIGLAHRDPWHLTGNRVSYSHVTSTPLHLHTQYDRHNHTNSAATLSCNVVISCITQSDQALSNYLKKQTIFLIVRLVKIWISWFSMWCYSSAPKVGSGSFYPRWHVR